MQRWLYSVYAFFLLINCCCSNAVIPIDPPTGKDPRTYTWTIDTLFYTPGPQYPWGQTTMNALWGLNDSVLYAVGHDSWGGGGVMWKFNGTKWDREKLMVAEGGTVNHAISLNSIKGFSDHDIYAVGESSTNITGSMVRSQFAAHFDGLQWKEVPLPKGGEINSVAASHPSLIYCGGSLGALYRFDGSTWSLDTIQNSFYPEIPRSNVVVGMAPDDGVYIHTVQYNERTGAIYEQFMKYNNHRIVLIDSGMNSQRRGTSWYWQSPSGTVYSCGDGGVYRLTNEKWQLFHAETLLRSIGGLNDRHIFAVGDNTVFYYNGKSWNHIYTLPNSMFFFSRIWCSENQVFITYTDNVKTYILHGK